MFLFAIQSSDFWAEPQWFLSDNFQGCRKLPRGSLAQIHKHLLWKDFFAKDSKIAKEVELPQISQGEQHFFCKWTQALLGTRTFPSVFRLMVQQSGAWAVSWKLQLKWEGFASGRDGNLISLPQDAEVSARAGKSSSEAEGQGTYIHMYLIHIQIRVWSYLGWGLYSSPACRMVENVRRW